MSPADSGLAIKCLKSVPRAERQPALVLLPVPAPQHLVHRRLEVVVADPRPRHPARHRERGHVPFQQRLLRAGGVDPVHAHPRERQPVGEQLALRRPAVQPHQGRPEVDLGLGPRLLQLRHEPFQGLRRALLPRLDLRPAPGNVPRDVLIRRVHVMLIGQPGPDPPPGMPLLARRVQVLGQHRIDQRRHLIPHRRRPLGHLPRLRHRRRQRLVHRPPVHPVLPRDRPDPHPGPAVLPDQREQSHLVPSHLPLRERETAECSHYAPGSTACPATRRRVARHTPHGGSKSEENPQPRQPSRWVQISVVSGAISEWHGHSSGLMRPGA